MLQAAFYALLIIVFLLFWRGFSQANLRFQNSDGSHANVMRTFLTIATVWVAYVMVISGSGFLADFSLPPKMVLFVVFPALLFIAVFFSIKKTKAIIDAFPIALPVYFQTFRIFVELLIWGLYQEGVGPELATYEGRNFDILAGITAPVVGYLAYNKNVLSQRAVLIWNFACLALLANIVFIFISLVVRPQLWGFEQVPISTDFTKPPYIFIAAVFMPSAVFMHVMSIRKTLNAIRNKD